MTAHRPTALTCALLTLSYLLATGTAVAESANAAGCEGLFHAAQERFQHAQDREMARDPQATALYEAAAGAAIVAVDRCDTHPDADVTLYNGAIAYEEVDRFESARHCWRRLVDQYPESRYVDDARFRLAFNAYRLFEYDQAATHFAILAKSSRNQTIRSESIINAATILTTLQRYSKAAPYWQMYAEPGVAPDDVSRTEAAFRAAEMSYKAGDWSGAIKGLGSYITKFRAESWTGARRVQAAYLVAQSEAPLSAGCAGSGTVTL